jgi:hypothetical protein
MNANVNSSSINEQPSMWRLEKFDFNDNRIQLRCPVCLALLAAPITAVMAVIPCYHADCSFTGRVEHEDEFLSRYRNKKAAASRLR